MLLEHEKDPKYLKRMDPFGPPDFVAYISLTINKLNLLIKQFLSNYKVVIGFHGRNLIICHSVIKCKC